MDKENRINFQNEIRATLGSAKDDYVREVVCHGASSEYDMYKASVEAYKKSGKLKRLLTRNPEVTYVPIGFTVSKLIEKFSDTIGADKKDSIRIMYPAAGGDVAGLLSHIHRLAGKDITIIFVDPGESQTGTPTRTLVPELQKMAPPINIENHVKKLSDYLEDEHKPVDILLYDSPSLHHGQAAVYGTSPIALEGVSAEKLQKLFHSNSFVIGDNKGINQVMDEETVEYFQENFSSVHNDQEFPILLHRGRESVSGEDRVAANM